MQVYARLRADAGCRSSATAGCMPRLGQCGRMARLARHPLARTGGATDTLHGKRDTRVNFVDTKQSPTADATELVGLPLEWHQCLGLAESDMLKDSVINSAYDDFIQTVPEAGYSGQLAIQRAQVLDLARSEIILRRKSRSPASREDQEVTLPVYLVPGALALMNELGEYEVCLSVGYDLLESGDALAPASRRDVMLALALANCGHASGVLAADPDAVVTGCSLLEDALELLQAAGGPPLAPGLQADILRSLQPMRARCVLEQLQAQRRGEAPREGEARQKVLSTLKLLLTTPTDSTGLKGEQAGPGGSAAAVSSNYADEALGLLDSAELAGLLDWPAVARSQRSHAWCSPGLLHELAVACILTAYQQRAPAHVMAAAQVLKQLPSDADVLVTRAVCDMLLGQSEGALRLLQQAQAQRPAARSAAEAGTPAGAFCTSQDALRFVQAASPEGGAGEDGLLPGLCLYTEQWLAQVALPAFQADTSGASAQAEAPSLVAYFGAPRVQVELASYSQPPNEALAGALSRLRTAGLSALAPVAHLVEGLRLGSKGSDRRRARGGAAGAAGSVGGAAAMAAGVQAAVEAPVQGLMQRATGREVPLAAVRAVLGLAALGAAAAGAMLAARSSSSSLLARAPHAASAAAAAMSVTTSSSTSSAVAQAARMAAAPGSAKAAAPLSVKVAEALVHRWEGVKANALGAKHDVSALAAVLADPCLTEFRAKVSTFQQQGWHMRYSMRGVSVTSVEALSGSGNAVRVVAQLDEAGSLHAADGRRVDGYSGGYQAAYTMVRSGEERGSAPAWRIAGIQLLSGPTSL